MYEEWKQTHGESKTSQNKSVGYTANQRREANAASIPSLAISFSTDGLLILLYHKQILLIEE